jgi:Ca2+-binding EF-hand superfamily protein
MERKFLDEMNQ